MRSTVYIAIILFAAGLSVSAQSLSGKSKLPRSTHTKTKEKSQQGKRAERTMAAAPNVAVVICIASGDITVHGWDRNEVRARSSDELKIDFTRKDGGDESKPARNLELRVSDDQQLPAKIRPCDVTSDLDVNVPRGASLQVHTRNGDIRVTDVAAAYVSTQSGEVIIEHVVQGVEANSMGGGITVKNSKGRVKLHSAGGSIEAVDVSPADSDDSFEAVTASGDITLQRVKQTILVARTVNGSVDMTGPLAHGGHYAFKTFSGDVTLTLPADASFRLSATISDKSEIITDFPLTMSSQPASAPTPAPSPAPAPRSEAPTTPSAQPGKAGPMVRRMVVVPMGPMVMQVPAHNLRRINGTVGSGDAVIEVASFSGTLHLEKK